MVSRTVACGGMGGLGAVVEVEAGVEEEGGVFAALLAEKLRRSRSNWRPDGLDFGAAQREDALVRF